MPLLTVSGAAGGPPCRADALRFPDGRPRLRGEQRGPGERGGRGAGRTARRVRGGQDGSGGRAGGRMARGARGGGRTARPRCPRWRGLRARSLSSPPASCAARPPEEITPAGPTTAGRCFRRAWRGAAPTKRGSPQAPRSPASGRRDGCAALRQSPPPEARVSLAHPKLSLPSSLQVLASMPAGFSLEPSRITPYPESPSSSRLIIPEYTHRDI